MIKKFSKGFKLEKKKRIPGPYPIAPVEYFDDKSKKLREDNNTQTPLTSLPATFIPAPFGYTNTGALKGFTKKAQYSSATMYEWQKALKPLAVAHKEGGDIMLNPPEDLPTLWQEILVAGYDEHGEDAVEYLNELHQIVAPRIISTDVAGYGINGAWDTSNQNIWIAISFEFLDALMKGSLEVAQQLDGVLAHEYQHGLDSHLEGEEKWIEKTIEEIETQPRIRNYQQGVRWHTMRPTEIPAIQRETEQGVIELVEQGYSLAQIKEYMIERFYEGRRATKRVPKIDKMLNQFIDRAYEKATQYYQTAGIKSFTKRAKEDGEESWEFETSEPEEDVKTFYLNRKEDETGISGTGRVAYGIVLPTGRVAVEWVGEHASITVFKDPQEMLAVHGHNGKTEMVATKGEAPKSKDEPRIRKFSLKRKEDETGISGTGMVAFGAIFPSGKVLIEWTTDNKTIELFKDVEEMMSLHGHEGKTQIEYTKEVSGSVKSFTRKGQSSLKYEVWLNDKTLYVRTDSPVDAANYLRHLKQRGNEGAFIKEVPASLDKTAWVKGLQMRPAPDVEHFFHVFYKDQFIGSVLKNKKGDSWGWSFNKFGPWQWGYPFDVVAMDALYAEWIRKQNTKTAQVKPGESLQKNININSPRIEIDPTIKAEIQDAVEKIVAADPNYFVGVSKIVALHGGPYGQVSSEDPSVVHLNVQRIINEVKSKFGTFNANNPEHREAMEEAVQRVLIEVISHEKGHVGNWDPEQHKFPGGEGVAEQESHRMMKRLFPQSSVKGFCKRAIWADEEEDPTQAGDWWKPEEERTSKSYDPAESWKPQHEQSHRPKTEQELKFEQKVEEIRSNLKPEKTYPINASNIVDKFPELLDEFLPSLLVSMKERIEDNQDFFFEGWDEAAEQEFLGWLESNKEGISPRLSGDLAEFEAKKKSGQPFYTRLREIWDRVKNRPDIVAKSRDLDRQIREYESTLHLDEKRALMAQEIRALQDELFEIYKQAWEAHKDRYEYEDVFPEFWVDVDNDFATGRQGEIQDKLVNELDRVGVDGGDKAIGQVQDKFKKWLQEHYPEHAKSKTPSADELEKWFKASGVKSFCKTARLFTYHELLLYGGTPEKLWENFLKNYFPAMRQQGVVDIVDAWEEYTNAIQDALSEQHHWEQEKINKFMEQLDDLFMAYAEKEASVKGFTKLAKDKVLPLDAVWYSPDSGHSRVWMMSETGNRAFWKVKGAWREVEGKFWQFGQVLSPNSSSVKEVRQQFFGQDPWSVEAGVKSFCKTAQNTPAEKAWEYFMRSYWPRTMVQEFKNLDLENRARAMMEEEPVEKSDVDVGEMFVEAWRDYTRSLYNELTRRGWEPERIREFLDPLENNVAKHAEEVREFYRQANPSRELTANRKLTFGIDIDDVIADLHGVLWEMASKYIPLDEEDKKQYHIQDTKHGDKELRSKLFKEMHDKGIVANMPTIPGAVEKINELHDKGHRIILITARSQGWRDQTEQWLKKIGLKYDKLVMTAGEGKSKEAREEGIDIFIDDRPDWVESLVDTGDIKVMVFDQPWNTEVAVPRIKDWKQVKASMSSITIEVFRGVHGKLADLARKGDPIYATQMGKWNFWAEKSALGGQEALDPHQYTREYDTFEEEGVVVSKTITLKVEPETNSVIFPKGWGATTYGIDVGEVEYSTEPQRWHVIPGSNAREAEVADKIPMERLKGAEIVSKGTITDYKVIFDAKGQKQEAGLRGFTKVSQYSSETMHEWQQVIKKALEMDEHLQVSISRDLPTLWQELLVNVFLRQNVDPEVAHLYADELWIEIQHSRTGHAVASYYPGKTLTRIYIQSWGAQNVLDGNIDTIQALNSTIAHEMTHAVQFLKVVERYIRKKKKDRTKDPYEEFTESYEKQVKRLAPTNLPPAAKYYANPYEREAFEAAIRMEAQEYKAQGYPVWVAIEEMTGVEDPADVDPEEKRMNDDRVIPIIEEVYATASVKAFTKLASPRWSPEERARLKELYIKYRERGIPHHIIYKAAAVLLNKSYLAVKQKLESMYDLEDELKGMKFEHWDKDKIDRAIQELYRGGKPVSRLKLPHNLMYQITNHSMPKSQTCGFPTYYDSFDNAMAANILLIGVERDGDKLTEKPIKTLEDAIKYYRRKEKMAHTWDRDEVIELLQEAHTAGLPLTYSFFRSHPDIYKPLLGVGRSLEGLRDSVKRFGCTWSDLVIEAAPEYADFYSEDGRLIPSTEELRVRRFLELNKIPFRVACDIDKLAVEDPELQQLGYKHFIPDFIVLGSDGNVQAYVEVFGSVADSKAANTSELYREKKKAKEKFYSTLPYKFIAINNNTDGIDLTDEILKEKFGSFLGA